MDEPYDVGSGLAPGTTAQRPGGRVDPQAVLSVLGAFAPVVAGQA
jgi:hypothetical protein